MVWVASLLVLLGAGAMGTAATGTSSYKDVLSRIQALDQRVQSRLEVARLNSERGTLDGAALATEVRRFAVNLDALEAAVRGLPAEEREVAAAKLHALVLEVSNLRLAGTGAFAPSAVRGQRRGERVGQGKTMAPPNDLCSQATLVVMDGVYAGDSSAATNDGQASCGASMLSPDVWFRYVPASTGEVAMSTLGSGYDTVLSVHTACPGTIGNEIACNDDIQGLQSGVSFWAAAGSQYLIRLAGMNGAVGPYQLTVSLPGTISGVVTRADTGEPVQGHVDVWSVSGVSFGYDYLSSGEYDVGPLPQGTYYVSTDAYDSSRPLRDELWDDIPCQGGAPSGCDPTTGDPVSVVAGGQHTGVDFVLDAWGGIGGTVTDSLSGSPVAYAQVTVWGSSGSPVTSDQTGYDGVYEIRLPQPGTYYLTVSGGGFDDVLYDGLPCPGGPPTGCDPTSGTPVVVDANTLTGGVDFAVQLRGQVSGTVHDGLGSPVPWASVELFDSSGSWAESTYAENDGTYALVGVEDGTYYVTASEWGYATALYQDLLCPPDCDVTAGTPVTVSGGGSVSGVDFVLQQLGSIAGSIVEAPAGLAVGYITVTVYNASGAAEGWGYTFPGESYVADNLWAGDHFVVAEGYYHLAELYDNLPCSQGCDPLTGTPVPVEFDQQTSGIDFTLVPRGSIAGTVVDQATGLEIGVPVALYDHEGQHLDTSYSGPDGYQFAGLADGVYFAVAGSSAYSEHLEELYDDIPCWGGAPVGCNPTTGVPIPAAAGILTTGVDFALLEGGEITGTVQDAGGGSPGDGYVRVLGVGGAQVASDYWSDYDPSYEVRGLPPGSYHVVADSSTSHRDEVWQDLPCNGEYPENCSHLAGTQVQVTIGGVTSGVDFTLDRLGAIEGLVLDGSWGVPLQGVRVVIFDSSGSHLGSTWSSSSGGWQWTGLWPGVYFSVTSVYELDYVDQLYDGILCPGGSGVGCDPLSGTPIPASFNSVTSGVDFRLPRSGGISGRVVDEPSGVPVSDLRVGAWDSGRTMVAETRTDTTGTYQLRGLVTGTYFVATRGYPWNEHLDELFDDIPCLGGPPGGCDPAKGTPVAVVQGSVTRFVDFALLPWGREGIAGTVTDVDSGFPIQGVALDFWDDSGQWAGATVTSSSGAYLVELNPGTYRVSTDNPFGYLNEVFDDLPCPGGSAYSGACNPLFGDPVVVSQDAITGSVDFALESQLLFGDGFESGSTSAWSAVAP